MIKGPITHPGILRALAAAGHGATVLIADGHFPTSTIVGPKASIVYLNLEQGWPTVPQVLRAVVGSIAVEKAIKVTPTPDALPCLVHDEIDSLLSSEVDIEFVEKSRFYEFARSENLALCIATGDQRRFGNVMLTIGVLRENDRIQSR